MRLNAAPKHHECRIHDPTENDLANRSYRQISGGVFQNIGPILTTQDSGEAGVDYSQLGSETLALRVVRIRVVFERIARETFRGH